MSTIAASQVYSWLGVGQTPSNDDAFVIGVVMSSADRLFTDFLGFSVVQAVRTEFYPDRINLMQRDQFIDGWERAGNTNMVVPIDRYRTERRALLLRHVPVRSITSIYESPEAWLSSPPDFGAEWLLNSGITPPVYSGPDYSLDVNGYDSQNNMISYTGMVIRNTGPWCVAERCVKVTYTAGFSAEELGNEWGNIQHAYMMQCQAMYNTNAIHRRINRLGSQPGILTSESLGDWSGSYDAESMRQLYGMSGRLIPGVAVMLEPYINYSRWF